MHNDPSHSLPDEQPRRSNTTPSGRLQTRQPDLTLRVTTGGMTQNRGTEI
jgi:hypothetical protein